LAPFVKAYRARLRAQGYTPLTMVSELHQLAHLSRWLEAAGLGAADVNGERLEQFVLARRGSTRGKGACSLQSLVPLLELLSGLGVVTLSRPTSERSSIDVLVGDFREYLLDERGLAASTADEYVWRVRRFLAARVPDGDVERLSAADVTSTVMRESASMSVASMHHLVFALRSFLRFCYLKGLTDVDLSAAALTITGRRRSSLPMGISPADVDALLKSCDRRRAIGRRDYAVLLSLLRLGLRAGEVAALTLDDVDWRAAEIVVHGKGGRLDRLPLPGDVGEAIVAYLQRGRLSTGHRELFLRALAPIGPLAGSSGVSWIVRRACRRAGIPEIGAHRLRHTTACEMVAAGVPLPEIGEVLRHRSVASTALYARVDLDALRSVALPWPGGDLR
jgi:site-specific recombinase XerD